MASIHQLLVLFLTCLCWLITCQAQDDSEMEHDSDDLWPVLCPHNTFYSRHHDQCLVCSQCPINKIIIASCQGLHDTKCGPFYDFKKFAEISSSQSEDKLRHLETHQNSVPGTDSSFSSNEYTSKQNLGASALEGTSDIALEFADSEWKSVTICLFVFLSFFAIIILVVGICIIHRRTVNDKKLTLDYSPPVENV